MAEKKVEIRDIAYEQVASAIMQDSQLSVLKRHKEGLVLEVNGEVIVLRAIKKKADLDKNEFRGEYFHDEKDNVFAYREYKAKTG